MTISFQYNSIQFNSILDIDIHVEAFKATMGVG